jgi:carbonic anhydrase/acetyltransferase-like protein (isoleucine patch superfamily)
VQDNSTLHVTGPDFPLHIGDRVVIGHKAVVHGCTVEDDSMIGMGAIILDGCKIGAGSVVAAGSLLTPGFVVPPGSVVMGAPAKIKKQAGEAELTMIRRSWSHYVDLGAEYLSEVESRRSKVESLT